MACAILKIQLTKGLDMELSADKINIDMEMGYVTITGFDVLDVIREIGVEELLKEMDYESIVNYVREVEEDKKTEDEDYRSLIVG